MYHYQQMYCIMCGHPFECDGPHDSPVCNECVDEYATLVAQSEHEAEMAAERERTAALIEGPLPF